MSWHHKSALVQNERSIALIQRRSVKFSFRNLQSKGAMWLIDDFDVCIVCTHDNNITCGDSRGHIVPLTEEVDGNYSVQPPRRRRQRGLPASYCTGRMRPNTRQHLPTQLLYRSLKKQRAYYCVFRTGRCFHLPAHFRVRFPIHLEAQATFPCNFHFVLSSFPAQRGVMQRLSLATGCMYKQESGFPFEVGVACGDWAESMNALNRAAPLARKGPWRRCRLGC